MTRRSQMEILVDILRAVADGKHKRTHIMYMTNVNWTRLKKHLNFLTKQDMLVDDKIDGSTIYNITRKGKEVLKYFMKIEGELCNKKKVLSTEIRAYHK